MKKENTKGFTLIELLVVIAIIGILSAVVLASLNSARNKGSDAAIQFNLSQIRTQAEIYSATNKAYSSENIASLPVTSCTTANSIFDSTEANNITKGINGAVGAAGADAVCILGGTSGQKASSWAVSVPLKSGSNWCVDSTGTSQQNENAITTPSC